MSKIFNALFAILKYLLLVISIALVLMCIMLTYKRLEKSLVESWQIFLPFAVLLICYIINLLGKQKAVNSNLFYNFVSVLAYVAIIIICVRSLKDTNMVLFYKYKINFNPSFFSDNVSTIQLMAYCLAAANIFLMFTGKKKKVLEETAI